MSETELQSALLKLLDQLGVWAFRVNAGKAGRRWLAPKGTPDIWTEFGWIEVKLPGGELNPDQVAWHKRAKERGVNVAVVRSGPDLGNVIRRWRDGE